MLHEPLAKPDLTPPALKLATWLHESEPHTLGRQIDAFGGRLRYIILRASLLSNFKICGVTSRRSGMD